jgi:DNA-directed RNA polymerase sigma subunit (sigma70/sigma32)
VNVSPSGTYQAVARPAVTPAPAADSGAGSPAPAAAGDAVFTQTDQLTKLLAAVREAPEVRADVVAAIAERLAAGEFDTPAAAAAAAQNLLGDAG